MRRFIARHCDIALPTSWGNTMIRASFGGLHALVLVRSSLDVVMAGSLQALPVYLRRLCYLQLSGRRFCGYAAGGESRKKYNQESPALK